MFPILERYIKAHPQMAPTDLIKFCYQSVFGPGHMAPGREMAEQRIRDELAAAGLPAGGDPVTTELEGAVRLDIGCGLAPRSIAALFCRTADHKYLHFR